MEAGSAIDTAKHVLGSAGIILAIGSICGAFANKIKIPDIVLYLLIGMVIGPAALGIVDIPADSALNQIILLFGSAYILFDGGATVRLKVLKEVWVTLV
ncbi:MAG TPA: cation:proton antiporter, partial [Permianibacter sp.]|nr:cation:proton antiporter [Permianibacter sp.]